MATEMDALSIQITGSSANAIKAIDNLIGKLKDLDNTFKTLSSSSTYANNLETAVHSITRVHNAIANINAQHISDVAKAMKSLSTSGNALAGFGNIAQAGKAMDGVSAKAQSMAKNLAKTFDIRDKDAIDSITSSIKTMINTMGKGDAFYAAERNVEQVIEDFGRFENKLHDVEGSYEKVRNIIRNNPLYVPDNYSSNANWLSDLATIGIKNTTHDINAGVSAGKLAQELEGLIPALRGLDNEADIIHTIADHLRDATSATITFAEATKSGQDYEAWYRINDAIRATEQSLGIIAPTLEQVDNYLKTIDFNNFTPNEGMSAITQATQEFRDSLQAASTNISALNEALQQTAPAAQPFDKIVSGLSQLEGVTIGDFSNITTLAEGVNKLGYQSAVTASTVLPQIAEGLRGFEGIVIPKLEGMESFAQGLRSMGAKAVQNAAYSLPFVADGLKQLKSVGDLPKMENLTEFAQSLSVFGRVTAERAVSTIPQLAQAFQQLFTVMSKAPTISRNTIDAANAMANLAARTGGVTSALTRATPRLNLWSGAARNASKHTFSLASAIGKVYATYWMLFRAFGMIKKSIDIASDLTEVRNVVVQTFGDMAYKATEFAEIAGESFGLSKLEALDAASRYQAMGKTMGITNAQVGKANDFLKEKLKDTLAIKEVQTAYGDLGTTAADMSINLTKLAGDLASLYNTDIEVAAEKLNSIFTGTTKPLRDFGLDLTQATLQEWAMKNGIDANVKSMTQAEKALLRYQYVMANASFVMGDFQRTSDSWHNTIVALKLAFQNLGSVIGQGFINLLKPAIQKITAFVNTLTKLVEKALNAIGKLLGWQVEIDPVKPMGDGVGGSGEGMEDLEDAAGGAGKGAEETAEAMDDADKAAENTADNLDDAQKAAKKMRDYLLGIDELNVFQPQEDTDKATKDKTKKEKTPKDKADKSGSGSGSGKPGGAANEGGATGGNVRFEKYKSEIESWYDLGKTIADTIGDALWNIDWKSIQNKAEKAASNLAHFLNGIFASKKLWTGIGHTIAEGLNTALSFMETFIDQFNFGAVGRRLGDMINQAVEDFKWAKLGRTIAKAINGVFETIWNFGITFKADKLGEGIATAINEFFSKLDAKWIARGLNIWVDKIKELLGTILKKTKWIDAFKKLKEVFDKLEPDTVVALIGVALFGTKLGRAIGKKVGDKILSAISSQLAKLGLRKALMKALADTFKGEVTANSLGLTITLAFVATWKFLKDAKNLNPPMREKGENPLSYQKRYDEWNSNRTDLFSDKQSEKIHQFWEDVGFYEGFDKFKQRITEWQSDNRQKRDEERQGFYTWCDDIYRKFSDTYNNIKNYWGEKWDGVKSWFETNVQPWFTKEKWNEFGTNIKSGLESKWDEFKTTWGTKLSDWWNNNVVPWFSIDKWKEAANGLKEGIVTKWTEFKSTWANKIQEWWNTNVAPWFTIEKWQEEAQHFKEAIKKKWDETVQQWKIDLSNWWRDDVQKWFKIETWLEEANHFKEAIKKKWDETSAQWKIDLSSWWTNDVQKWFKLDSWLTEANHIKEAIKKKWDETVSQWRTDIKNWWENDVKKWFSASEWEKLGKAALDGLKQGFENAWGAITQWWDEKINAIKEKISNLKQEATNAENNATPQNSGDDNKKSSKGKTTKKAMGGVFDDGRWRNVHAYASGGMPDEGQLFWARESGAELVGTIGGNTAVMNNDQIVASVSAGVQQAVTEALAPYLADISTNTRVTANKDFTVQIGDRQIAEANNRGQRSIGAALFT